MSMSEYDVICRCRSVKYGDLQEAVAGGAATYEEVQARTECGTGCMRCEDEIRDLLDDLIHAKQM